MIFSRKFAVKGLLVAAVHTVAIMAQAQSPGNPECINVPNNPDPCCASPVPSWCPVSTNPWPVLNSGTSTAIENYLLSIGLPGQIAGLPFAGSLAGQAADYIVGGAQDLLNDLNGVVTTPTPTTLMDFLPLLGGREQLTSLVVSSVASIGPAAFNGIVSNRTYDIPYVASTDLIEACQSNGGIHRDRNFDHGPMNPVSTTGNLIYKTNVGVPTQIAARRPSWGTRLLYDHYWMWWFGDSSMVPRSSKDRATTSHVYPRIGDYDLKFLMLETGADWFIGFNSNANSGVSWSDFSANWSANDDESPDACNYATMQVLPNNAPNAVVFVANTDRPDRKQFRATSSNDPDGNPLTYHWRFSDGSTSTSAVVTRTFNNVNYNQTMTATLTVSDGGRSDVTVKSFSVGPFLGNGCHGPSEYECW